MKEEEKELQSFLEPYRRQFKQGDYTAFMHVLLLCCWNDLPLPKWVADVVIRQAHDAFDHASTGPGRQGNWRAQLSAIEIDRTRAGLAEAHLRARYRSGRSFVSDLATVSNYGTPRPGGGANVVSRDDIFEFVSKKLRGTLAVGSKDAVKDSWNRVRRAGALPSSKKPAAEKAEKR